MNKRIQISFKETTDEMQLYTEILTREDRGNWIKAVLRRELEREKKKSKK